MKTAWLAIGLLACPLALANVPKATENCDENLLGGTASIFAPTQVSKAQMKEKNGWDIRWLKKASGDVELLAIQRSTLTVRRLNPLTGESLGEKQLIDSASKSPDQSVLFTTTAGEILVAAASTSEKSVQLFSDSGAKLNVELEEVVRRDGLMPIVLNDGKDVFVVAATVNAVYILKRDGEKLEIMKKIPQTALISKIEALEAGEGQIAIAILGSDHKVRQYNWDDDVNHLSERPGFVQLGGTFSPHSLNGQTLFVSTENSHRGGTTLRLLSTGSPVYTQSMDLNQVIGGHVVESANGRPTILVPVRNGDRSELVKIDALKGTKMDAVGLGDARSVTDLSSFLLGGKRFMIYTKDSQIVYIQSENEASILPAPPRSRIKQVTNTIQLKNGQSAVAILGEGPGGSGISVITLNR